MTVSECEAKLLHASSVYFYFEAYRKVNKFQWSLRLISEYNLRDYKKHNKNPKQDFGKSGIQRFCCPPPEAWFTPS